MRTAVAASLLALLTSGLAPAAPPAPAPAPTAPAPTAPAPTATAPTATAPAATAPAVIAGSPDKVVAYREKAMKAIGDHFGAAGMLAKGDVTGRNADMVMHATALSELSHGIPDLFPAGTGPDVSGLKTEAKAEVWTQHDKFVEDAKAFETEAGKLADVAKTGDVAAFKAQFGKVGEACGNCHDAFRVKD